MNIKTSVGNMLNLRWPLDVKTELSERQMCASGIWRDGLESHKADRW